MATTLVLNANAVAVTLSATASIATGLVCPSGSRYLQVEPVTVDAHVLEVATDGASVDTSGALSWPADTISQIRIPGSGSGRANLQGAREAVYLASGTASAVVRVRATSRTD